LTFHADLKFGYAFGDNGFEGKGHYVLALISRGRRSRKDLTSGSSRKVPEPVSTGLIALVQPSKKQKNPPKTFFVFGGFAFAVGGPTRNRTLNLLIKSQMLYQLSYWPIRRNMRSMSTY
jgi:hypothetical protein